VDRVRKTESLNFEETEIKKSENKRDGKSKERRKERIFLRICLPMYENHLMSLLSQLLFVEIIDLNFKYNFCEKYFVRTIFISHIFLSPEINQVR